MMSIIAGFALVLACVDEQQAKGLFLVPGQEASESAGVGLGTKGDLRTCILGRRRHVSKAARAGMLTCPGTTSNLLSAAV
jgi:hypothetical protein